MIKLKIQRSKFLIAALALLCFVSLRSMANSTDAEDAKRLEAEKARRAAESGAAARVKAGEVSTPSKSQSRPASTKGVWDNFYMPDLQRRIKRAWFPPHITEAKVVVVTFNIHAYGEVSQIKLLRSSGSAIADQAAVKAVENAAPFRPLPAGEKDPTAIEFTFDYDKFSARKAAAAQQQ